VSVFSSRLPFLIEDKRFWYEEIDERICNHKKNDQSRRPGNKIHIESFDFARYPNSDEQQHEEANKKTKNGRGKRAWVIIFFPSRETI